MRRVATLVVLSVLAVPIVSGDDALPAAKGPEMVVARLQPESDELTAKGLTELFKAPEEAVTTKSGMLVAVPPPDVLVARLNDDGKVETECVASIEAAQRFLVAARVNTASTTTQEK